MKRIAAWRENQLLGHPNIQSEFSLAVRSDSLISFSLDDMSHLTDFNLLKTLDALIDGWCERRALSCSVTFFASIRDRWRTRTSNSSCLHALKDVKGLSLS